jgi:NhaP-type Na+/H+ or K+/H+ antiporter
MVAQDAVFSVATILAGGALLLHSAERIGIPYSVLVYLYGITVGCLSVNFAPQYVEAFREFPPSLIFHIFLPILIFEGSYAMKIHALYDVFPKAVILAGPGLVLNTVFVAAPLRLMYPEWSWASALLLGSVLSATDPVAVVSLLKDLGVDRHLTSLIDGEAIMNDGTAIVLFRVLYPTASAVAAVTWSGGEDDATKIALAGLVFDVLRLTVGAYILGKLFGYVQGFFINSNKDNDMVTSSLTVGLTFISYFVAEDVVGTSGVLTLFFQGLYLSYNCPSMFPGTHGSSMHVVWEFLAHLGNTLLFCLVGIILAEDMDFTVSDVCNVLLLYVVLNVARLAMIGSLMPVLNVSGRRVFFVRWREGLLMTHSGLRGGIAAVLALSVAQDDNFSLGREFLKLTSGVVFLTLVINATTAGRLVSYLQFKKTKLNKHVQMQIGLQRLAQEARHATFALKRDPAYSLTRWDDVQLALEALQLNPLAGIGVSGESDEIVVRALLMRAFKVNVWHQRDSAIISERVARLLTSAVARCSTSCVLLDADHLPVISSSSIFRFLSPIFPTTLRKRWEERDLHDQLMLLLAAEAAYQSVAAVAPMYSTTTASKELAIMWVSEQLLAVQTQVALFAAAHSETISSAAITHVAVKSVLAQCAAAVEDMHEKCGFTANARDMLLHTVKAVRIPTIHEAASLPQSPGEARRALLLDLADLLRALGLSEESGAAEVARRLVDSPDASIARFNALQALSTRDGIHIVLRGVCSGPDGRRYGRGDFLGVSVNVLPATNLPHEEYSCVSEVICLRIAQGFRSALSLAEGFMWKCAALDSIVPLLMARRGCFLGGWSLTDVASEILCGQAFVLAAPFPAAGFAASDSGTSWSSSNPSGSLLGTTDPITNSLIPLDSLSHLPSQHARSTLFFMFGGDESGFFSAETRPGIVPKLLFRHTQWKPGTIFVHVFFRHSQDHLQDASASVGMESPMSPQFPSSPNTELTTVPVGEARSSLSIPSPMRLRHEHPDYNLRRLATPSPAINALTNDYLWFLEVVEVGSTISLPTSQAELMSETLSFLVRFSAFMPGMERKLLTIMRDRLKESSASDQHCSSVAQVTKALDNSWRDFSDTLMRIIHGEGATTHAALNFYPPVARGIEACGLSESHESCHEIWDLGRLSAWMRRFLVAHCTVRAGILHAES